MTRNRPTLPPALLAELNRDAAAAGFTSRRIDAKNSRWVYFRKLLALGRQYKGVLSLTLPVAFLFAPMLAFRVLWDL